MKQNSPEEAARDQAFASVMKRLQEAGMVRSFSKTRTPAVIWKRDSRAEIGGRAIFLALADLLAQMSADGPLTPNEQSAIQMIREAEIETPSPEV